MAHKLVDAVPQEAREAAAPFAPMLGHLSPKLRERLWGSRIVRCGKTRRSRRATWWKRCVSMPSGVQIQLALALSGLGQQAEGACLLDSLLQRHADKGAVTLGSLHDARLQVARLAGDQVAAALHAGEMKRLYGSTRLASLLERIEQVAKPVSTSARPSAAADDADAKSPQLQTILQRFEHGGGSIASVPEWTLRQLAKHASATEAYLFQRSGSGAVCTAQVGGVNGEVLAERAARRVRECTELSDTTVVTNVGVSVGNTNLTVVEGVGYRLRFLMTSDDQLFGPIALSDDAIQPSNEVLSVMANRLARG
jgi:hypothetical protein